MHYIVVTESESVGPTTCNVEGLYSKDVTSLDILIKSLNLTSNKLNENVYEVDIQGVRLLNILSNYGYRVCSQSMVVEKSDIGSRVITVQKIIWTMSNP